MLAEAAACPLLWTSTLAGAAVRPLLEVTFAFERVTLPELTVCPLVVSTVAGLAADTERLGASLEEAVLLEGVVAVLLEGVVVVLLEGAVAVLLEAEPVLVCLFAVVPLEAELLVLLEVEVVLVERRTWLEELVVGAAVLREAELEEVLREAEVEVLLETEFEEVLLLGAAVVVADLLSEEFVLLLVEVAVVLRLA